MTIVLHSGTDPDSVVTAVRKEIHELDPNLPVYLVRTMEQIVGQSLARRRFSTLLLSLFAGIALVLAVIGIYGVMAYLINQGAREIGIRMALGATPGGILKLVLRQGMSLALLGVFFGLIGAYALTRFMSSLLFGIAETDALTFLAIPSLLLLVSLLASYIPARRATRLDPMVSLRCE
jgi:ABC-type antimicrobial peptide transport system permease subunit